MTSNLTSLTMGKLKRELSVIIVCILFFGLGSQCGRFDTTASAQQIAWLSGPLPWVFGLGAAFVVMIARWLNRDTEEGD